jgi:hypothetical protein
MTQYGKDSPHSRPLLQHIRSNVQQNDHQNNKKPNTSQLIDLIYWIIIVPAEDRPLSSLLSSHKQITNQDTNFSRPPHKDDGTKWFTALLATWILLPYARTLTYTHRPANTTRIRGLLAIICFAANSPHSGRSNYRQHQPNDLTERGTNKNTKLLHGIPTTTRKPDSLRVETRARFDYSLVECVD